MATDNSQTLIREQFEQLPEVVQDTILNSKWEDKIRKIVQNNKLHIDQGAALENLVFFTMLGLKTPDQFIDNVRELIGLSEEQAYAISIEAEREIFGQIRKQLVEITENANTVNDIGRVADELNKVSDDINARARSDSEDIRQVTNNEPLVIKNNRRTQTLDISGGKRERKSLKEAIPVNYFNDDSTHSLGNSEEETKQRFAAPQEIAEEKVPEEEKATPIPIRKDLYREPIEEEVLEEKEIPRANVTMLKAPIKPILLDDGEEDETPIHKIASEIPLPETANQKNTTVISGNELVQQDIQEAEESSKKGLFGIFKRKKKSPVEIEFDEETIEEDPNEALPISIVAEGLAKPLVSKKEQILLGSRTAANTPKPDFVKKPETAYNTSDDPYREPAA